MIFNINELPKIDFSEILETSLETVRMSIDGTKTFVKWYGEEIPEMLNSLESKEGPFTYEEILEILSQNEWTIEIDKKIL